MLYLEVRLEDRLERIPLRTGESVLGRDPQCDVVVEEASISRRHARLIVGEGMVRVQDLGSTNGLWSDGLRVEVLDSSLDHWFVVGSILARVRRGVSLRNLESHRRTSRARRARRAGDPPSITSPRRPAAKPEERESGSAWLERITARIAETSGRDAPAMLLQAVEDLGHCDQVQLLRRQANGWCMEAASSNLTLAEEVTSLIAEERSYPRLLQIPSGAAILIDRIETDLYLAAAPWRSEVRPGDARLAALTGLLRWWSGLKASPTQDAPDNLTTDRELARERPTALTTPFVTASRTCRKMLEAVDRLAPTDLPLIVFGESGTGKELVARRLHEASLRRHEPFVAINCAALPAELLEAELFGIERGVATGVTGRPGKFAQAHLGTLFLDEIADLSPQLQPKLLRAIESKSVVPLGATDAVAADARIVAATHVDLSARVDEGSFRRDLWYRLKGATVEIPPLRSRPEDIMPLARYFVAETGERGRPTRGIEVSAAEKLLGYAWPGNVRELRHVIRRAIALCDGPVISAELLPEELSGTRQRWGAALSEMERDWRAARTRFDRLYFEHVIERCGHNLARAAREAGLSRSNLYRKLDELGIERRPAQRSNS